MSKRKKRKRTWFDWIGFGGLSFLLLASGIAAYLGTIWRYRLVLRDEFLILSLPAPIIGGCLLLTAFCCWAFKEIATAHGLETGWASKEHRRYGDRSLYWNDALVAIIPGAFGLGVGLALLGNCAGDATPTRTHQTVVLHQQLWRGRYTSFQIHLTDWKRPGEEIALFVPQSLYETLHEGETIQVKTKAGGLGYEWIVEIGSFEKGTPHSPLSENARCPASAPSRRIFAIGPRNEM